MKANGGKVAVDDVGFLLKSVPSRLSINRIYVDAPYSSRAREVIP